MKKFLLSSLILMAAMAMSFGQVNVLDFETVQDPLTEPFDLKDYQIAVANPDKTAPNTSDFVGKVIKQIDGNGDKWWGGTNIRFGGEIDLTGSDTITIDCYAAQAGPKDTINFRIEVIDEFSGNPSVAIDGYYTDANDTAVNKWKTISYDISGITGSYTKIVIFFNWIGHAVDGDVYYFDNVVLPGYNAFGSTDVTFNITDKFDNATDIKLFVDGTEETLTKTSNVYSATKALAAYNVTAGKSQGVYEFVYSHMANGTEKRDTVKSFVVGHPSGAQEVIQLIIVEEVEDGTADAVNVGGTPPTIDGTIDAVWSNAKIHTMQERSWWGTPTGLYSTWKLMWDIDNLYILTAVEDATPQNSNTTAVYQNDCVEFFFDMNKSAGTPYDADDFQIRVIRDKDTLTGSIDAAWSANIVRAQVADANGYVIEMAIPWSSLSAAFLPIATTTFNFDISTADVTANMGTRTFREAWGTAEDKAYFNTEDFGTVTLVDAGGASAIYDTEVTGLSIFPNPAQNFVTITSDYELSSVSIHDITGRVVNKVTSIKSNSAVINVNNLIEGIYIINVVDSDGAATSHKIRIF